MQIDLVKRTLRFLLTQGAILVGVIMLFLILSSVFFVKNAIRWHLSNIEQDVIIFSQQTARSGEVPKRGDLGSYTFFIIGNDGKYILPRLPRGDERERLWQEYETKLIYEMQKRRDGWSYYPDEKSLKWGEGRYVIRYVYLEKQGWIVAAEGVLPGSISLLEGFLTAKLFLGLFLMLALAMGLMLFNAFWHFNKVMRAVARSHENNFIAVPSSTSAEEVSPFVQAPDRSSSGGGIHNRSSMVLPKHVMEPAVAVQPEQKPQAVGRALDLLRTSSAQKSFSSSEYPEISERHQEQEAPSEKERVQHPKERSQGTRLMDTSFMPRPQTSAAGPRSFDGLGEVTVDTTQIKSPLLRKAIEQIRGE